MIPECYSNINPPSFYAKINNLVTQEAKILGLVEFNFLIGKKE